ncbi:MAG: hypothetical protein IT174_01970 [Acidobacteria bacterium]|nr:hypothetical protein [Acidobacteriota bacterium]
MKRQLLAGFVFLLALSFCALAQAVTVTPKKTVYKRPRPISKYKRTFTVTYPRIRAATPALSKKIETAISYSKVLGLNVNEEINEVQWLEEADYTVDYNDRGIFVITLSMNGSGAYPDGSSKTIVIDTKTGHRIGTPQAFRDTSGLLDLIRERQKAEIGSAIEEIKKDPDAAESDPSGLFSEKIFSLNDLDQFALDANGITFIYDYEFPHVIEALEPEGRYKFTWKEIAKFIKPGGPLASFISK